MGKIDIIKSIEVNAKSEDVWEIIGPNFVNIADWSGGILKSWENKTAERKFKDAPAGGRFCDLGSQGIFEEKILHYNSDKMEITWSAKGKKLPKFVTGLQNALKVKKLNENSCRITTNISANANGFLGFLMGGIMKKQFSKLADGFVITWKNYAETGDVSEEKKRELAGVKK
jgi:hypothetical protein